MEGIASENSPHKIDRGSHYSGRKLPRRPWHHQTHARTRTATPWWFHWLLQAGGTFSGHRRRWYLVPLEDQGRPWCSDWMSDPARNLPSYWMKCLSLCLHRNGRSMLEPSIAVCCRIGQRESQTVMFLSHQPGGRPELCTLDTEFQFSAACSRGSFDSWNRS